MAISIVNGYLCYSGCDAAKARSGQNPHPAPSGAPSAEANAFQKGANAGANGDAVIYGGILGVLNATSTIAPSSAPGSTAATKSGLNIVA